jgi:hypothetical protein
MFIPYKLCIKIHFYNTINILTEVELVNLYLLLDNLTLVEFNKNTNKVG